MQRPVGPEDVPSAHILMGIPGIGPAHFLPAGHSAAAAWAVAVVVADAVAAVDVVPVAVGVVEALALGVVVAGGVVSVGPVPLFASHAQRRKSAIPIAKAFMIMSPGAPKFRN